MIKDYTAYLIHKEHEAKWQSLVEAEARLEAAKAAARRAKDEGARSAAKEARRDAEAEIKTLCKPLAKHVPHLGLHYLAATKLSDEDKKGEREGKKQLRDAWANLISSSSRAAATRIEGEWQLPDLAEVFEQPQLSLAELPPLSFRLSFTFTLAKTISARATRPFFSRDEEALYVIDNPVRKDKTLRLPFLAPASYKGLLRSAARLVIGDPPSVERDNEQITRLFGTDRREQTKELRQGRLWCFPTFFHEVGLQVINPHLRDTGAGANPILFETATGAGNFHLLYLPFDLTPTSFAEVAEDLRNVARTVKELFTAHGLGAKTSSGFGLADEKLEPNTGRLEIKAAGLPQPQAPAKPTAPQPALAGYLKAPGQLKDEFVNDAGQLVTEDEYKKRVAQRGQQYTKQRGWDYDKARKWWEREGQHQTPVEPAPAALVAQPAIAERSFESFTPLVATADELATALERLAGGGR